MVKHDMSTLSKVNEIVSRDQSTDAFGYIRNSFYNGTHWFEDDGLLAEFKPIGAGIYTIHTYGHNRSSIRDKREFTLKAGRWMLDNTECLEVIVFVPKEHTRLRLAVASFADPCGETPGLYLYSFSEVNRNGGKECHQ